MTDELRTVSRHTMGTAAAVVAGVALLAGVGWSELGASTRGSALAEPQSVTASTRTASLAAGRDSYSDVVKRVSPAVVTIRTEGRARPTPTEFGDDDETWRRFFGDPFERTPGQRPRMPRQRGLGSGVVVSADGYILTNHHVIDRAERIVVELSDRRTVTGTLIGSDRPSDLALLKVDAGTLQPLVLGDSTAVEVGDVVLAVGNPLGIGQTVTMGIISAKGRSTGTGAGTYEDFLQTDAPINHGNSGGALVNTKGELIGINSQILSVSEGNIGIGFSIPANMARHVMDALKTEGRVRRARLGVTVQPVTSDLAESLGLSKVEGAIVSRVEPGSAADEAGVERGDVITSFNGRPVQDYNSLRNRVAESRPGSSVPLIVLRDGKERTLSVKLEEVEGKSAGRRDERDSGDHAALGVSVAPLTPEVRARAGLDKEASGVWVRDVDPEGRAAAAGVQPNDIIQEVNRQPVEDVEDLRAAVRTDSDRPLLLLVHRNGQDLFLTVRAS